MQRKKLETLKNPVIQRISVMFSEVQDLMKKIDMELNDLQGVEPDKADTLRCTICEVMQIMSNYIGGMVCC